MRTIVIALGSCRGMAMQREPVTAPGVIAAGQPPGVLVAVRLDHRVAVELRVDRVGATAARDVLAAQPREHAGQLLGGDQHVARLRALRRADDLARLQQIHQASGLGEADAELALQHRGRAELRRDDELGRREQQLEVVADVGVDLLLLGDDRDIRAVLGPRLRP